MNAILYPGSFDPITLGHVDVIGRLAEQFDRVVVLVADSPRKSYFFSQEKRKELILNSIKEMADLNNRKTWHHVRVACSSELTVEFAKREGIRLIARSVRTVSDWEYEYAMADANRRLWPEIETFFIMASAEHGFISSSLVREVALFGGETRAFVPKCVAEELKQKVRNV